MTFMQVMQESFIWSGFIQSVTTIEHIGSGTEYALTVPCSQLSSAFDVQGSALPSITSCLSEHASWVIDLSRRGQLDVTFVVSVFVVVILGLSLFTSFFMHCIIPMAYIIAYTQMTCRSIIPVGARRFCLCISLLGIISITGCILIFYYKQRSRKGFFLILLFRLFANTASLSLLLQYCIRVLNCSL